MWACWGTIPQKLCRSTRRVRVGPCRGTLHGQCPPGLQNDNPGQGWILKGSELTELKQDQTHGAKLKSSWRALCSGSERVPPRENLWQPPGSSRSSFNSTHKRAESPSIHPSLLGICLSSFQPLLPPLQLLQRPTSTSGLHPAHTKPRLGFQGRGALVGSTRGHLDTPRARGKDGEQRMKVENGQHIPTSFCFLDLKGFLAGPLLFPSPPRAGTSVQHRWHGPCTSPWCPSRYSRCYLVSRDSRYSSAMS